MTTVTGLMFTDMKHPCPTTLVDATLYGCFELCWRDIQCYSFFLRRSRQRCCLARSRYLVGNLSSAVGINYYWLYPDYCQPDTGYTLSRQADLCFQVNTGQKTWDRANHACKTDGGSLIKVNTPRKIQYIRNLITSNAEYNSMDFAIGGTLISGQWAWSDGSEITHVDWAEDHTFDSSKTRVVMAMTSGHKWKSVTPTQTVGYICQLPFLSLNPYV
ncbi:C-type lectin lectoxin-Lio3-like [Haliotis cracherodii]|uniref:C-type lectin lectoxin-Lio3-like n=1 Tax=Haliotis cracherodii TaxID=6455 RepID=UPI0039EBB709